MAGSGVSLGAIYAKLGVETQSFQDGLKRAERSIASTAGTIGQQAGRMSMPLSMANVIITRFGDSLASLSTRLQRDLGIANSALGGTLGATTSLAGAAASLSGQWGTLNTKVSQFGKITPAAQAATLGLYDAAFQLGQAIGTLAADEIPQLKTVVNTMASGPFAAFSESLVTSKTRFEDALYQYDRLRTSLKLSGPEWEVGRTHTTANAQALANLSQKALLLARAQNEASASTTKNSDALLGQRRAATSALLALHDVNEALRKQYGVLSKDDLEGSMRRLVADFGNLSKQGVSAEQILAKMAPSFADIKEAAAGYSDLAIPTGFKALGDALEGGSVDALKQVAQQLKVGIPTGVQAGTESSKKFLDDFGEKFKGTISGGLGNGVVDGINAGKQALIAWRANLADEPFKLTFDVSGLKSQIAGAVAEAMSGRVPNTAGKV